MSAERGLWAAVVFQAFADAFAPVAGTTEADRRHALRFLLSEEGPWASRRDEVAAYIGTEGEIIRRRAEAILSGKESLGFKERSRVTIDLEQARILLEGTRYRSRPSQEEPLMRVIYTHPPVASTWLCFQVREDGTLILPKHTSMTGLHDGLPLPNGPSFQARIMRELTKPFGAALQSLRRTTPNWVKVTKEICDLYGLEVILKEGPFDVPGGIDDMTGTTKAYLRRRLPRAA